MIIYKSWGVGIEGVPCSKSWRCLNCGFDFDRGGRLLGSAVVGFSKEKWSISGPFERLGGIIMECPNCFEKIWFHVDKRLIEHLMEQGIKFTILEEIQLEKEDE